MSSPSQDRKRRYDSMDVDVVSEEKDWVNFRLLCPNHRSGHVIGKGGEIIKKMRDDTGARIKLDTPAHRDVERIVHISSLNTPGSNFCPAQEALLQVVSRIFDEEKVDEQVTVRMLMDHSQTGGVIGRDGKIITELRDKSNSQIKILSHSKPSCAQDSEDLVQVSGTFSDSLKGLMMVSERLRQTRPRVGQASYSQSSYPQPSYSQSPYRTPLPPLDRPIRPPPLAPGRRIESYVENPSLSTAGFVGPVETIFRLLVPDVQIGCVIGKQGKMVKAIREDTGARVRVVDLAEGCEERVVECSSLEGAESRFVASIEALLQVLNCLFNDEAHSPEPRERSVVKMLVPSNQVGAVLGKGGSTIKQIRQETGTHVVVQPKQSAPSGKADDEVLQIEGVPSACIAAVKIVTMALRGNMIRNQANAMDQSGRPYKQPHYDTPSGHLPPHMAPLSLPPPPPVMEYPHPPQMGAGSLGSTLQKQVKLTISDIQVGTLLGNGGANIQAVRKLSGAKVKIHDERSNNGSREVEISGTLIQTQAAENLISQALETGNVMVPY